MTYLLQYVSHIFNIQETNYTYIVSSWYVSLLLCLLTCQGRRDNLYFYDTFIDLKSVDKIDIFVSQ